MQVDLPTETDELLSFVSLIGSGGLLSGGKQAWVCAAACWKDVPFYRRLSPLSGATPATPACGGAPSCRSRAACR